MQCRVMQGELSALIDGELSARAEAVVRHHVATCGRCALVLEDLVRVHGLAGSDHVAEGRAPELTARIMRAVAGAACMPVAVRRRAFTWRGAAAAAAAAVLLGVAVMWPRGVSQPRPVENLVASTEKLLVDISATVAHTGRGIRAAPARAATQAQSMFTNLSVAMAADRVPELIALSADAFPEGVSRMSSFLGNMLGGSGQGVSRDL